MKRYIFLTIIVFTAFQSTTSFAWGKKGHSLVAEVAFNYLDPATRKVLLEYLDGMTIQDAANWMDDIKSDKAYDYLRKLHYINAERGQKITANNEENIIGALTKTIEELKNHKTLSKEEVKTKLCILFHLVGDLHQPLHVGYGEDKGGNNYQINFYGRGTNLHSFYDSGIIEYKTLSLPQCLKAKTYSKEEVAQIEKIDVIEWANQSRSYLPIIYKTYGAKINDSYVDANFIIIQEQIQKAGIRLSSVLKDIFK
ncbi:S1/P1 nuclease [Flavobacterium sp.]|uniref:S1/P1 nuclease n=1 Tax=Flavobacterium sp. TaxID=239 RepID=UPI003751605D